MNKKKFGLYIKESRIKKNIKPANRAKPNMVKFFSVSFWASIYTNEAIVDIFTPSFIYFVQLQYNLQLSN